MRVTKDGDWYRGSHIPGPTHNLLRMRVQSSTSNVFDVAVLPPVGGCSHGLPLDGDEVRDWISVGVKRGNDELGTHYGVAAAEIVANDSRRPEVYAELARRIILAAHGDGVA
jgi:hypothetical protein